MAEIDDQILVVLGLLEQLIGQKCDMASQMQQVLPVFRLFAELYVHKVNAVIMVGLRQGFLNLARSRQSMGSSKLNRYSFPFKFEPCATAELEDGRWHVRSDLTPETSPLKWYGVLVPKALRLCQSNFVKGLLVSVRVLLRSDA